MNLRAKITLLLFIFTSTAMVALIYRQHRLEAEYRHPAALFETVDSQIKAFRSRNFPDAYQLASSGVRSQWSLDEFTRMVRGDFSRVLRAERVEFGPWERKGRQAVLQVFFIHADETVVPCVYTLVREDDVWKVDKARWVRGWPTGQRMRGIRS